MEFYYKLLFPFCSPFSIMAIHSQLISGKEVSYFIALTQTHCIATKKTDARDKTKAASIAAFLQSLILLGAHFHRAAFRDTSKRRSPPWKCTCSSSTVLAGQALKCGSTYVRHARRAGMRAEEMELVGEESK